MSRRALVVGLACLGCGGGGGDAASNDATTDTSASGDADHETTPPSDGGDASCPAGRPTKTLATYIEASRCGPRIGVDATRILWLGGLSAKAIWTADKDGAATTALISGGSELCDFRVDDDYLYWTTFDAVKRTSFTTGTIEDLVASADAGAPDGGADAGGPAPRFDNFAYDASDVFFVVTSGTTSSIRKVPIGGGAPTELVTVVDGPLTAIAVGAADVVALDPGPVDDATACTSGTCNYSHGRVLAVPKDGSGPLRVLYADQHELAADARGGRTLAVDGSELWFMRRGTLSAGGKLAVDGAVTHGTVDGAPTVDVASGFTDVQAIAVDATTIYFGAANHLYVMPRAGGAADQVGYGGEAIAVDGEGLYWFVAEDVVRGCK